MQLSQRSLPEVLHERAGSGGTLTRACNFVIWSVRVTFEERECICRDGAASGALCGRQGETWARRRTWIAAVRAVQPGLYSEGVCCWQLFMRAHMLDLATVSMCITGLAGVSQV